MVLASGLEIVEIRFMKDIKLKEKFIDLRARGLSFDKISKEIGVSKPTLIKWSQEYSSEVANLLYLNTESLLEEYRLLKKFRIEGLVKSLHKALNELERRDFEKVKTSDLLTMVFALENKLKGELSGIKYHTGDREGVFDVEMMEQEKTLPLFD